MGWRGYVRLALSNHIETVNEQLNRRQWPAKFRTGETPRTSTPWLRVTRRLAISGPRYPTRTRQFVATAQTPSNSSAWKSECRSTDRIRRIGNESANEPYFWGATLALPQKVACSSTTKRGASMS